LDQVSENLRRLRLQRELEEQLADELEEERDLRPRARAAGGAGVGTSEDEAALALGARADEDVLRGTDPLLDEAAHGLGGKE
jgi:hypothetical protein